MDFALDQLLGKKVRLRHKRLVIDPTPPFTDVTPWKVVEVTGRVIDTTKDEMTLDTGDKVAQYSVWQICARIEVLDP